MLRQAGQMALAALLQSGLVDKDFALLLVGKVAATKQAKGAWLSLNGAVSESPSMP